MILSLTSYPVGRRLAGQRRVQLFYEQMVSDFVPRMSSYSAANTFWNDTGMAMEEEITAQGSTTARPRFSLRRHDRGSRRTPVGRAALRRRALPPLLMGNMLDEAETCPA